MKPTALCSTWTLCLLLTGFFFRVNSIKSARGADELRLVRGVTISCQTWGWEWGQAAFGDELDQLQALGANWVAIHPYASIKGDGYVNWRSGELEDEAPAQWLSYPVRAAHERGMGILMKPHLAYWGSPFSWRGAIRFEEGPELERFWEQYCTWIVALARKTSASDAFCIGTELENVGVGEEGWRELIRRVRGVTDARLIYASNWDHFEDVSFWDALDAIGIQAYFPLTDAENPDADVLRSSWSRWLVKLRDLHERTGKPVVFTELGYDDSVAAAARPWEDDRRAKGTPAPDFVQGLQARCLRVSLQVLSEERAWLRGAFLWKWFVGEPGWDGGSFAIDQPALRDVIRTEWRGR